MKILLAAGEVSGDRQAAHLARALRAADASAQLYGIGGPRMREAGVDLRVGTAHLGSVGFQESLRYVRPLRAVLRRVAGIARAEPPDLAVLVDNEGFNLALARVLRRRGIPIALYFAPQVWFWGRRRAKSIARWAELIVPAFEAEAEIYRGYGGRVAWLGHPLVDVVRTADDVAAVYRAAGLDPVARTVAILPGSRMQEVEALTGPMLDAVHRLLARHPDLQVLLPLAAPHLRARVAVELDRARLADRVRVVEGDTYSLLSRCELALMSSGTATLEAALLGLPMVVAYRVSPLTFFIAKRLVKHEFAAMPNILAGRRVVPELLQEQASGERLAAEALALLEDPGRAAAMRAQLAGVRGALGEPGVIDRAARRLLALGVAGAVPVGAGARDAW